MYRKEYQRASATALMLGALALALSVAPGAVTGVSHAQYPPALTDLIAVLSGVGALFFGAVAAHGLHKPVEEVTPAYEYE